MSHEEGPALAPFVVAANVAALITRNMNVEDRLNPQPHSVCEQSFVRVNDLERPGVHWFEHTVPVGRFGSSQAVDLWLASCISPGLSPDQMCH